jgi:hypothetical protein
VSKFCINFVSYNESEIQYIKAHTCFNRIDLPDYPTYEELKKSIEFIIVNEIIGFGIE